jgi:hypothetical protein
MITGIILQKGTMRLDCEEVTGVFIECTKEQLQSGFIPLYQRIVVILDRRKEVRTDQVAFHRLPEATQFRGRHPFHGGQGGPYQVAGGEWIQPNY